MTLRPLLASLVLALLASGPCRTEPPKPQTLSGDRALRHVKALVALGNRAPGSSAHRKTQAYIVQQLRLAKADIEEVDFTAATPRGAIAMKNIIGKFPGQSSEIVVVAGHYDTLFQKGFVGANDGASSAALLLELARVFGLKHSPPLGLWVVFFDGEEAVQQWSDVDGLYGSRHQVAVWGQQGVLPRIKAVLVVDMIGDKNLALKRDLNSTPWLTDLVWAVAKKEGYAAHFIDETTAVMDDHSPFVAAGVPAVDLIDFDYGPANGYWHTPQDTVDKLSAGSLTIVGAVVLATVEQLSQRWPGSLSGDSKRND